MALISCRDVSMTYENTVALRDLSFTVESGDYLCILGENGSGKSTLIKGLLGLKTPTRGSITFGDRSRARENLAKLELSGLEKRSYRELSGGQQQRVLLARALCATRKLLLLDEPVSGLDPVATAHMYRLLEQLNRNEGITIVMVSHDVHAAVQSANRILHLHTQMLYYGPAADYFRTELGRRFLGDGQHE